MRLKQMQTKMAGKPRLIRVGTSSVIHEELRADTNSN